jgi:membrane-associated protein
MEELISYVQYLFDFILHIDKHLVTLSEEYGTLMYWILFLIIFVETGLVVTPFLPGDSLLFAAGMLAATGVFNVFYLIILLIISAFLGNFVNFHIGKFIGPKVFDPNRFKWINKEYLLKTQTYFDKHGVLTIVLSRFLPIFRTFVPFIAGIGKMNYTRFILYTLIGGIAWVTLFTLAGYFFGNIPIVKNNFSKVVLGIIILSILPVLWTLFKNKKK